MSGTERASGTSPTIMNGISSWKIGPVPAHEMVMDEVVTVSLMRSRQSVSGDTSRMANCLAATIDAGGCRKIPLAPITRALLRLTVFGAVASANGLNVMTAAPFFGPRLINSMPLRILKAINSSGSDGSGAREQALLDDGVNAPVAVHDLRDAEVHRDRHQGDRLVLAQALGGHQEVTHLPERILHRQVDRGLLVDLALRIGAQLGQVVRVAEPVEHPLVLGLQQRVVELGQRGPREARALVHDELEGAGQRALDGGAAELGVALRGVRVARREQRPLDRDRVVHRGALADAPVVDVAPGVAR